jgi:uncharacterized protein
MLDQIRPHSLVNDEPPYKSLHDAIVHWPETATAFIVRLQSTGRLEFIAPYGFDDFLRLIVTNTPPFDARIEIVLKRINEKGWCRIWPRLKVVLSTR